MKIIKNYIDGSVNGVSEKYQDVFDPSKGERIAKVILSNKNDFDNIINSSYSAQRKWSEVFCLALILRLVLNRRANERHTLVLGYHSFVCVN